MAEEIECCSPTPTPVEEKAIVPPIAKVWPPQLVAIPLPLRAMSMAEEARDHLRSTHMPVRKKVFYAPIVDVILPPQLVGVLLPVLVVSTAGKEIEYLLPTPTPAREKVIVLSIVLVLPPTLVVVSLPVLAGPMAAGKEETYMVYVLDVDDNVDGEGNTRAM